MGKTCLFGITDLRDPQRYSATKYFCERVVGHSGARLLLPIFSEEKDFAACRYFTHWASTMSEHWLADDSVLNEDGTTDGGCSMATIIPPNDPDDLCPPCRTSRCALQLPNLALNWENTAVNPITNAVTTHPCLADGNSAPSLLATVDLEGTSLSQGGRFQKCTFLGGRNDYLLTGAAGTNSMNAAFRAVTPLFDAKLQISMLMEVVGDPTDGKQHIVVLYTTSESSPASVLIDLEFGKDSRECRSVRLPNLQLCVSVVNTAAETEPEILETYLSLGLSSSSFFKAGDGLSVRVATQTAAAGLQMDPALPLLNAARGTPAGSLIQTKLNSEGLAGGAVFETGSPLSVGTDHTCLSGIESPTPEMRRRGAIVPRGGGADAGAKCVVLGRDSSLTLQTISATTVKSDPPTAAKTEECFNAVKTRILAADAQSLDVSLIDHMLTELHLIDVSSLQSTIAQMRALNISAWLDRVKECSSSNPILAEFVCAAYDDETLLPNIGDDVGVANKHIKDAVHYAIVLDYVTEAISAASGAGVLKDVYDALTSNRPGDWMSYFNTFEIAKTLTMQKVMEAYIPQV